MINVFQMGIESAAKNQGKREETVLIMKPKIVGKNAEMIALD